jgi:AcrR family transcriptional regulator
MHAAQAPMFCCGAADKIPILASSLIYTFVVVNSNNHVMMTEIAATAKLARAPGVSRNGSRKGSAGVGTAAMCKPKEPEANRARIIQAGIAEFASRGFAGASMDAIAARTHTTRAMINYYFGNKEKVYLAVLEHVYAEIRHADSFLDLDHLNPVDAIRRIVEFTFHYYVEHDGFVRLVVAENQAKGRHFRKSRAMRSLNRPIIDTLARVIARGQADGAFRSDLDPVEVHMAIAALGIFNVTNQYTFGAIFQLEMGAKGDVVRRRTLATEVILGYLRRTGGAGIRQ